MLLVEIVMISGYETEIHFAIWKNGFRCRFCWAFLCWSSLVRIFAYAPSTWKLGKTVQKLRENVCFFGPKHQQYPSPKWKMLNITHRGLRWFNYLNLLFSAVYMMFKGDVHRKPWTCERDLNKMNVYFRLLAESATSPDPISRFTAKCSGTQMEEPLMNFLLFDFTTCLF